MVDIIDKETVVGKQNLTQRKFLDIVMHADRLFLSYYHAFHRFKEKTKMMWVEAAWKDILHNLVSYLSRTVK